MHEHNLLSSRKRLKRKKVTGLERRGNVSFNTKMLLAEETECFIIIVYEVEYRKTEGVIKSGLSPVAARRTLALKRETKATVKARFGVQVPKKKKRKQKKEKRTQKTTPDHQHKKYTRESDVERRWTQSRVRRDRSTIIPKSVLGVRTGKGSQKKKRKKPLRRESSSDHPPYPKKKKT